MSDKDELTLSVNQANSLKRITKMPGWKIIEDFLKKSEEKYNKELKDESNDDMANIKACRKILGWIKDFRDLFRFTEISAYEDEQELKRMKGEGGNK
ncbi:hypothetical protein ES695_13155 [Candidatus Atribacteria bacterium 1244-E10-H5-B2]|nr:MAG: hypothetical protein ES695_13155 [Candidatus Atribacteria bacterium 1244-E10-H5-B2]